MTFYDLKLKSMTFQAWETKLQNSMTVQVFHDLYEPCEILYFFIQIHVYYIPLLFELYVLN